MIVNEAPAVPAGDRALVVEAFRRVQAARPGDADNGAAVLQAIMDALLQGRRDLFSLVKAGRSVG